MIIKLLLLDCDVHIFFFKEYFLSILGKIDLIHSNFYTKKKILKANELKFADHFFRAKI